MRLLPVLALTGCLSGVNVPGSGGILITEATNHNGTDQREAMRFIELTNVDRESVVLDNFAVLVDNEVAVPLEGSIDAGESWLLAVGNTEFDNVFVDVDTRIYPSFSANMTRVTLLFRDGEGTGGTPTSWTDGTLQDQLQVIDAPSSEWHACRYSSIDETDGPFDATSWVIRDLFGDDSFNGFTPGEHSDCE